METPHHMRSAKGSSILTERKIGSKRESVGKLIKEPTNEKRNGCKNDPNRL
jgi:hypothetical protein